MYVPLQAAVLSVVISLGMLVLYDYGSNNGENESNCDEHSHEGLRQGTERTIIIPSIAIKCVDRTRLHSDSISDRFTCVLKTAVAIYVEGRDKTS